MKGTIFEKSATSLQLWVYAMYLIASTRCGISAQLERELVPPTRRPPDDEEDPHRTDERRRDEPLSGDVFDEYAWRHNAKPARGFQRLLAGAAGVAK